MEALGGMVYSVFSVEVRIDWWVIPQFILLIKMFSENWKESCGINKHKHWSDPRQVLK